MEDSKERKPDIWLEGVKNYCAKSKLSLLCYIDEMLHQAKATDERDRLGRIKARIHNELSQLSLEIRVLIKCQQAGGDINPFREEIVRKESGGNRGGNKRENTRLSNPVL